MKNKTINDFIWNNLKELQNFQIKNIEMFDDYDDKYANLSSDDDIYDKELLAVEQSGGN